MEILMLFSSILLLHTLLFLLLHYVKQRRRSRCFLVDYAAFLPSDDRKVPTDVCCDIVRRNNLLELDDYKFLLKVIVGAGIGEESYAPRNVIAGQEACPTLADGLDEMDECFEATLVDLFAKTGVAPGEIDVLVVNVAMFSPAPSLTSRIVNKFRMREDVRIYNLSGMGCSASVIGVDLVRNMFRTKDNLLAVVMTTESIGMNWYAGRDRSMMLGNCLFRNGACAILLSNDAARWRHRAKFSLKHLVRTHRGANDDDYNCAYHIEDSDGFCGIYLSKHLPKAAARALTANLRQMAPKILPVFELLRFVVTNLRKRPRSTKNPASGGGGGGPAGINFKSGVDHFCLHAGGTAVIEGIGKSLNLNDYDLEPTRMSLHRFGNTSSASLWYGLGYMEAKKRLKKGEKILMVTLGAGFKCNSAIWTVERDLEDKNAWIDCIDDYPPQTLVNPYMDKYGWVLDKNHISEIPDEYKRECDF